MELFGGEPTLILLDELSVYLRKVSNLGNAGDQLTAFLTSMFKAVESTPNAVLVYTLAIGKDGRATDAYQGRKTNSLRTGMAEAESVSARKATLLNPTEEDETVQVLRRRLFESIDDAAAGCRRRTRTGSCGILTGMRCLRPPPVRRLARRCGQATPFIPEVLETLTSKTATLGNFQRVRGMLRLLARTVAHLWSERPADATAIHLHHMDPGYEPIRQEIVTRLEQSAFCAGHLERRVFRLRNQTTALAQEIDAAHHGGLPPYASSCRPYHLHAHARLQRIP